MEGEGSNEERRGRVRLRRGHGTRYNSGPPLNFFLPPSSNPQAAGAAPGQHTSLFASLANLSQEQRLSAAAHSEYAAAAAIPDHNGRLMRFLFRNERVEKIVSFYCLVRHGDTAATVCACLSPVWRQPRQASSG